VRKHGGDDTNPVRGVQAFLVWDFWFWVRRIFGLGVMAERRDRLARVPIGACGGACGPPGRACTC
jgi:hypothetical protein